MMNKKIDFYMALPYRIVVTPPDAESDEWVAEIPDLPGCITYAATWDDLQQMIHDAKETWIKFALEDGRSIPEPQPVA
jgi:antitoxin HicB